MQARWADGEKKIEKIPRDHVISRSKTTFNFDLTGPVFEILVAACFRYILKPRPNAAWTYLCLRFSPSQTYSTHPIFMGVLSINTKRIAASVFHFRKEDSLVNKKFYTVIFRTNWSSLYNNWSRLLFFVLYCIINSL